MPLYAMHHPRDSRVAAIACLIGAMLCFGCIPVFLRFFVAGEKLDAWAVNAVRYAVAALFWSPAVVVLMRRQRGACATPGRSVWRAALVPAAMNLVGQVTYGLSPAYASAPTIGFLLRLSFAFAVLFGVVFIAEERRLVRTPLFLAGAGVCAGGVVTMFAERVAAEGSVSLAGLGILVVSTMGWGAYAVSLRKCMGGYPARLGFGVICLYTAVALIVLALLFGRPASLGGARGVVWGALAGSALLGIAFGQVFYYRGIRRLGPVVSSGVMLAQPIVTYTGAAAFLGETLTWLQALGGLGVVGGGALLLAAEARVSPEAGGPAPAGD
ncbi:MAG: DMT family transporter [Planctomycetes bacterium]|nr:DMT family transporter [Planctomycetota bacterium]